MPVSLERLIAEVEPNVITEELTRECIQVDGQDADAIEEKKKTMPFRQIETLAFSFKSISCISNLQGLDNLVKLQLDNNKLTQIANLDHLTNLTWLDLSFNSISKIEGLQQLSNLVDVSLFHNQVAEIENLDKLVNLSVLSIGNNCIKKVENVMYLRQFRNLRMVNLAGNPMCKDPDYKSYVLSHIKHLAYLDYRRVNAADVAAAMEQHQDEMIEIQEAEDQQAQQEEEAVAKATGQQLLKEANLEGIEGLLDDMVKEDPEWQKLAQIPGLLDGWNDIKDKCNLATDEFKSLILDQHKKKVAEREEWQAVVKQTLSEQDTLACKLISEFDKIKKKVARDIAANTADADVLIAGPKAHLLELKDKLLRLEMETVEVLRDLCQEFDRNYSEIAEINKGHYNNYFTQVRDLENTFFLQISALALQLLEKYNQENSDIDSLPEEARTLLQDKDTLMNALQASHDVHTVRIDALEDKLINQEIKGAAELIATNTQWESSRNRDRVSEIINFVDMNLAELEDMCGDDEADAS